MVLLRWNEKENRYLKQKFNTANFKEVLACLETIRIEADKYKTQWDQWARSRTTASIQELPEDSREKLESGSVLRDKLKVFEEELRILREQVNAVFREELHQEMLDQDEEPEGQKPEPKDQDEQMQIPQDLLTMFPA